MPRQQLADIPHGRSAIPFEDPQSPGRALVLQCYRPLNHAPDKPVVFVLHGMGRNGDDYREAWIESADRHGLLIVAPTFPNESWPGARTYNDGHVLEEDGAVRSREAWSNAIPANVFRLLQDAGLTTRHQAYLWGHSAGGQFVHRLMALQPHAPFEAVGAANAGWYTWPTFDKPYPEGLGGIGLEDTAVERLLAYPMVIFAGDQDIETNADNLPRQPAAMAQGPHRFARAHAYLEAGRAEAARRGVACCWKLVVVPGIGHEGMRMAAVAAEYWFDNKLPSPAIGTREVGTEL